jgi:hypothetical protein
MLMKTGLVYRWSWPADTNSQLTTATDLAYQKAIKGSRTGPYIMCTVSSFEPSLSRAHFLLAC